MVAFQHLQLLCLWKPFANRRNHRPARKLSLLFKWFGRPETSSGSGLYVKLDNMSTVTSNKNPRGLAGDSMSIT